MDNSYCSDSSWFYFICNFLELLSATQGNPIKLGSAQVVSCQTEPSQTFESLQLAAAQTAEFIAEIELKK